MIDLSKVAFDYNLIMIELTNCCNLDCDYCYRNKMNLKAKMLTKDEFLIRLERIKPDASILFCGMGEQLTHPDFYEFIKIAEGHEIQLVSNGTIPIDIKKIMEVENVKSITFSADGPDEKTALKSCRNYKFDVFIDNITKLSGQYKIMSAINYVISEDNLDTMLKMVDFCENYSINSLNLLLPTSNLKWVDENYKRIYDRLSELRKYVINENYKINVNMPDTMFCMYKGLITPYISVEGYVRPCCSHDKGVSVAGQIKKNSLSEIMNGNVWKRFVSEFDCNTCSMNKYHFSF